MIKRGLALLVQLCMALPCAGMAEQTEGKDVIILLMHEGKARTRRILPELVAYFREAGYEFRALSTSEEDRGILSRCGAHMMLPDAAQE